VSGGSGGCGWTRTTRESTSLVHGQRAHFSMQRGLVGHPRTESRHRPQSQSREQQSESERAPSALVVRSVPCWCLQLAVSPPNTSERRESILYFIQNFISRAPPSRRLPLAANLRENRKSKTPKAKRWRSSDVRRCRFVASPSGDLGRSGPGTSMLPPLRRTDANRPPRAVGRAARGSDHRRFRAGLLSVGISVIGALMTTAIGPRRGANSNVGQRRACRHSDTSGRRARSCGRCAREYRHQAPLPPRTGDECVQ